MQQTKLNEYKERLDALKSTVNTLPVSIYTPVIHQSQLDDLDHFLKEDDCLKQTDFVTCYKLTRLRLIRTTNDLDKANNYLYTNQSVVGSLIQNINTVINALSDHTK